MSEKIVIYFLPYCPHLLPDDQNISFFSFLSCVQGPPTPHSPTAPQPCFSCTDTWKQSAGKSMHTALVQTTCSCRLARDEEIVEYSRQTLRSCGGIIIHGVSLHKAKQVQSFLHADTTKPLINLDCQTATCMLYSSKECHILNINPYYTGLQEKKNKKQARNWLNWSRKTDRKRLFPPRGSAKTGFQEKQSLSSSFP